MPGGELFDYILKHHYLQETEAKRLFAQLISGVHYMHQKHIVHRDLKLVIIILSMCVCVYVIEEFIFYICTQENLLLSKDRDIIITDFGFANRFLVAQEDLMATSCGSPCYAAPELVINDDNNYVGTAVDIWSCGVILFAMLCGYLPFDDDPSNPQGANINVLYKYIVSTHLEIPKHMSKHATHLLRLMLVPDPAKRCTMDDIRNHPWLKDHWDLLHQSFIVDDEDEVDGQQQHMTEKHSDSRLFDSVKQTQDVVTMLPCTASNDGEENNTQTKEEPDFREQQNDIVTPIPPCATATTTTASIETSLSAQEIPSLEVAMNTTTIKEEREECAPDNLLISPPTLANNIIPTPTSSQPSQSTSFLQAKFFSTLQRHVSTNSPPTSTTTTTKARPASAAPYINANKIPNRSQSVQQRTASEYYTNRTPNKSSHPHPSLHILPSVSEQTTVIADTSASKTIKTKGQKLMDWFKRKPSQSKYFHSDKEASCFYLIFFYMYHTGTKFNSPSRPNNAATSTRFPLPERPISVLPNPVRAMSIGKPLGSYAADFNDSKLRLHRGAVDQDALTSKAPNEVIMSIKESLRSMGIDLKHQNDFKIKCVRPMRKRPNNNNSQQTLTATTTATPPTRTRKISTVPFKLFFSSSTTTTPGKENAHKKEDAGAPVIYGEQGIDNGDEVQFSVELSKIENLPGLYVVDIKRVRGNIWAFKFLYHELIDRLDLSGHGGVGYMAHRRVEDDEEEEENKNRKSYMTTSSSGSSMMMFDESTLHK